MFSCEVTASALLNLSPLWRTLICRLNSNPFFRDKHKTILSRKQDTFASYQPANNSEYRALSAQSIAVTGGGKAIFMIST